MAYSILNLAGNGTSTYSISFTLGYLNQSDVTCQVDNQVDGSGNPIYQALTWVSAGVVQVANGPYDSTHTLSFKRTVSKTELIHNYTDGEIINESNLDETAEQAMMAVQEVLDGRLPNPLQQDLDLGNHKIINLANGVNAQDAMTIGQGAIVIGSIANINAVAADITNINAVAGDLTDINLVATDLTNVNTVASNVANVNTVAGISSDVTAVSTIHTAVSTVATNAASIVAVAADVSNINAVASDLTAINAVNSNATNINTVAGISSNVTAVANDLTNINAVATDLTNINAVQADLTNINACAADLTAIDAAPAAATAAAASAASAASIAAGIRDTSTTSNTIATGAKTFTVSTGKQFAAGQFISVASTANSANYMHGQVTSYSGTSLVINVTDIGGSGTLASWNVSLSGSQGPIGLTGPAGSVATLTNTHILVGNASNAATDVAVSGDATMANTGVLTIAAHAVTNAKLAQIPAFSIKGNPTISAADAVDTDFAAFMTAYFNPAVGGMLYKGAVNWTAIAPGTAGQVLQTNGAAAPTWVAPGPKYVATGLSITGVSQANITNAIPATANRVTLLLNAVSYTTAGFIYVYLNVASANVVSGYLGFIGGVAAASAAGIADSSFIHLHHLSTGSPNYSGKLILDRVSGNTWNYTVHGRTATPLVSLGSGFITLSGALTGFDVGTTGSAMTTGTASAYYE